MWHHVVLSYDGAVVELYVDKVKTQVGHAGGESTLKRHNRIVPLRLK